MQYSSLGWQSWSWAGDTHLLKFPVHYYSPFPAHQSIPIPKKPRRQKTPPTGWCSWYAYGTNINVQKILGHARFITSHRIPVEYILIDDGWATWGDWLKPNQNKFPNGMKTICRDILATGHKAGLWIAPFVAQSSSILFHDHPDWFISKNQNRRHILDITLPRVRTYLRHVIHTVIEEWKFSYLKLDYLYVQHFNPTYSDATLPDQHLHDFLEEIHVQYPNVYLSACGCPLEPAVGAVDGMRISADIVWPQLSYLFPLNHLIHTQTLKQLAHNLRFRSMTHRVWHIDPDVFVCHPKYGFTNKQIYVLGNLIRKANGSVFLGDNLLDLSDKTIQQTILPLFCAPNGKMR